MTLVSCSEKSQKQNTSRAKEASPADLKAMIDSLEGKLFKDPYSAANRGLAMALVESLLGNAPVAPIPECAIRIRERDEPFEMVPLPFHRKPKSL